MNDTELNSTAPNNQAPPIPDPPEDDGIGTVQQLPRTIKRLQMLLHEIERSNRCLDRTGSVADDVTWHAHALKRSIHRALLTPVKNVWPCEGCGRPVCALRAFGGTDVFIVDAKAASEVPAPYRGPKQTDWFADIFAPHVCPEAKQ
jgi:hypothetical protein